jgi:diacylglycerol kinase family enzyme
MRLLAVANGSAGTADDDSVAAALAGLRSGADVEVTRTSDQQDLERALAGRGNRRVVVLGGDGSVHAAVAALDRLGALDPAEPIGIVAQGTGNDLARALGLPLEPEAGARAVLTGARRPMDLLRADDGRVVVNAVHVGVGARAGAEAERFKPHLGPAAYPLGATIAGLSTTGWQPRIEVDGRVVSSEAGEWSADGSTGVLMFAVCNGPTIAGGTPMAPGAMLDDGLTDVVVCTATGPVARAAFAVALLRGSHVDRPDVVVTRGSEVTFSGAPVDLDVDGEIEEGVPVRTWRVAHHAWSVIVPPAGTS